MKKKSLSSVKISFGINFAVLVVLLLFFYPVFETNDDSGMNAIANGLFGSYDEHLVFIHIWIGKVIKWLNILIPQVNWYSCLQYATIFMSLWLLADILIQKFGNNGIYLSFLFIVVFGMQAYICPQFTKTAGIAVLAGGIGIISTPALLLQGVGLIFLGALWRRSGFYMWIGLLVPFGFIELLSAYIKSKDGERKNVIKKYAKMILIFALSFAMWLGLWHIHDLEYEKSIGWKSYMDWDNTLSSLIDYFFPYYYDDYEMYESMGISLEDLEYYESWNIADVEVLSIDNLKRMAKAKETYWVSPRVKFMYFLKIAPENFLNISVFPFFLLVLGLFIPFREKGKGFFAVLQLVEMFFMYFALFYLGRVFVNRMDVPIWLTLCYGCVYYLSPEKLEKIRLKNKRSFVVSEGIVFMMVLSFLFFRHSDQLRMRYDWNDKNNAKEMLQTIAEDKENLYVGPTGTFPIQAAYGVFDRVPEGYLSNIYGTVGWTVNTPVTNQVLRNYGIENIFRDTIDNEHVYWVHGEKMDETLLYIQNNYVPNAKFIPQKNISGFTIYSGRT